MKTIVIAASSLAAIIHAAAKQNIRYYLNGLNVEASTDEVRVIGTDGHICAVARHMAQDGHTLGEGVTSAVVTIPRATVEAVNKSAKDAKASFVDLCQSDDGKWSIIVPGGGTFGFDPVDGVFPDYRRVFPATTTGEAAQFNPELMTRFEKMGKALKLKYPHVSHNGNSGALVTFSSNELFAGVIMPLRMDGAADASWVASRVQEEAL